MIDRRAFVRLATGASSIALARAAAAQTFTSITLSSVSFTGGAASGTTVGTITVTLASGTFNGIISLAGPDAGRFQVVGQTLATNGVQAAGTYNLTIIATQGCVAFSQPFTIVGTGTDSQAGTIITSSASALTIGGSVFTITTDGKVAVNGAAISFTSNVTALYTIDGQVFQFGSGNWYGPVTGTGANPAGTGPLPSPLPTVALSGNTVTPGSPSGTTVGTISVAVGAGTYTFAYSLTGANASSFSLTGATVKTAAALANGVYSFNVVATNAAILGGPWTLPVTVTIATGLNFPLCGGIAPVAYPDYSVENTLAARANQPGGRPTGDIQYNFYNNQTWSQWAGFQLSSNQPRTFIQVAPWPSVPNIPNVPNWAKDPNPQNGGSGFNPTEFITATDALAAYQALANNLLANVSNVIGVAIGWEWNAGGQNDGGWDAAGQRANYIEWFRKVALIIRATSPNTIIAWCGNNVGMNSGGTLNDFYPGDDVVDAVGLDVYGTNSGNNNINGTNVATDFGWLSVTSAATFLGTNHPAFGKAGQTMTLPFSGQSVQIKTGGRKYIVIPELQNTASNSSWISQVFAWQANTVPGRVLFMGYWDAYNVGDGTTLTTTNQAGIDWVAGTNNKFFSGTLPVPRLS